MAKDVIGKEYDDAELLKEIESEKPFYESSALQNASSASALLLTTEAGITEIPSDSPAMPQMGGGMGGGMGGMM